MLLEHPTHPPQLLLCVRAHVAVLKLCAPGAYAEPEKPPRPCSQRAQSEREDAYTTGENPVQQMAKNN